MRHMTGPTKHVQEWAAIMPCQHQPSPAKHVTLYIWLAYSCSIHLEIDVCGWLED